MQLATAKEIIDCLPTGKTRFYYFKDRYALLLLGLVAGQYVSKQDLRHSRFAKLLDKAVVKDAIRLARGGTLSATDYEAVWPSRYECYFLTLDVWGSNTRDSYYQTSRRGFNLVLQLNFSSKHDEPYKQMVDADDLRPFEFSCHPVAGGDFHTLAWARLDIDLASNEALVEEIQTDWIREAQWARREAAREQGPTFYWGSKANNDRVIRYVDNVLRHHEILWQEAMLSAAVWFLRSELGLKTVFYHTYESGADLKSIRYRLPPRSLYSKLPRRFCFRETSEAPRLLTQNTRSRARLRQIRRAKFFELRL